MRKGLGWKFIAECTDPCSGVRMVDRVCIKLEAINKEKYFAITMYLVPINASDYIAFQV